MSDGTPPLKKSLYHAIMVRWRGKLGVDRSPRPVSKCTWDSKGWTDYAEHMKRQLYAVYLANPWRKSSVSAFLTVESTLNLSWMAERLVVGSKVKRSDRNCSGSWFELE